ncbi:hypothetical protein H1S01_20765, partial [Heliobacterium chlorum]
TPKPTPAEFLLLMAEQLVAMEKQIQLTCEKADAAHERISEVHERVDQWDHVDTEGDARQRLNRLIRKYANLTGMKYGQAYQEFTSCFNIAYRTNLTYRWTSYMKKHNVTISRIEYLGIAGLLEDGLRVIDKMLAPHYRNPTIEKSA